MEGAGSRSPKKARIAVLPERVRNQIAAGEVIERPASVVKELVENALDAGSTRIQIDLEEGGSKLVRVSDDGSGMSRADLELAFVSHATSKLFDVSDLEHIASLGFRGEALASIGAVSRCRIFSREREEESGWRIENESGRIGAILEAGGAAGTSIDVRDLFQNVPARRRFLKRASTELARCLDVLQRVALAHEGVGFVATHDGRRLLDVEASMDMRARIRRTFGAEIEGSLVAVEVRSGDLRLDGFVAPPRFARADTSRQMWFLNGRPLKDRVLLRALKEGYRGFLFESRQPVAFLRLWMDPARVDVNVHPAKAEVRFRDERALFGFIVNALREAVARTDVATPGATLVSTALRREARERPAPGEAREDIVPEQPPLPPAQLPLPSSGTRDPSRVREPFLVYEIPARPSGASPPSFDLSDRPPEPTEVREPDAALRMRSAYRGAIGGAIGGVLGTFLQVARTYILREIEGGFEIIDQHALHERVTFEGLLGDLREGRSEVQRYLVPELIDVAPAEAEMLAGHFEALSRIGIDLSRFGPTTIAVNGLPALLAHPDCEAILRETIAVLDGARSLSIEKLLEEVLHRAACRSSVMAGDDLSAGEISSLLERGAALANDQTCVHGRPTRVRFTLADLEKAFHRR